MKSYSLQVKCTKENITLLCQVVFDTFGRKKSKYLLALGLLVIVLSAIIGIDSAQGIILCMVGCLILGNTDYEKRTSTKAMLSMMENWWPTLSYELTDETIEVDDGQEKSTFKYDRISRLLKYGGLDYVILSKTRAFMFDMSTLSDEERKEIEDFLEERSQKSFELYTRKSFKISDILHFLHLK